MAGTFSLDLSRICKGYKADIKLAIRKITMEAFKRVILRTPVDTGRARANWGADEGQMGTTYEIEATDKAGNKAISTATRTVGGWECRGPIFLSNNVPYILSLEHGSSTQAPRGMVKLTLAEMMAWAHNASNLKPR